MSLLTKTIGVYPKPEYVELSDWFTLAEGPGTAWPTPPLAYAMAFMEDDAEALLARDTHEVVREQVDAGIAIRTDGELRRENCIHYHCRHLDGFDFGAVLEKVLRNGAYNAFSPTVHGPTVAPEPFLVREWRIAHAATDKPVKITMPGPMPVTDTVVDTFYSDPARMGADVAAALNAEVRALVEAGYRHTQTDEPLFARKPDSALACGLDNLECAFHGAPDIIIRTLQMCCGYPDNVDRADAPKVDRIAYVKIADAVNASSVHTVSLEDTHRHKDLSLLEHFVTTTVIFGLAAIAKSRVEVVDELVARLRAALNHIDSERVLAAPDSGLAFLGKSLAVQKIAGAVSSSESDLASLTQTFLWSSL